MGSPCVAPIHSMIRPAGGGNPDYGGALAVRKEPKPGTFARVASEVRTGTFVGNARWRASRRKSKWNLLDPLFMVPLWIAFWWVGVELAWSAHVRLFQGGAGAMSRNWMEALGRQKSLSVLLMVLPPFFPAITGAMVVGNFLVHLIPPARRAMAEEARGFPGTDYSTTQRTLLRCTAVLLGIAAVLALIGAATLSGSR